MRRLALFSIAAVLATFLPSCGDDPGPVEPGATGTPSFELAEEQNEDYNASRITALIQAIEPPPGQLNATEKRWESIQRQMATGDLEAAREQMLALADKAVSFYEKGVLLTPDYGSDPTLPETAEEAVAELVMRLFVYVELTDSDALDRYPDFFPGVYEGEDSGFGVVEPGGEETIIVTENQWAAVVAPGGSVDDPVFVTLTLLGEDECDGVDSGLQEAYGCWDINRVPAGEFNSPVTVEICVDATDVPADELDYLRVHKVADESTGEIIALPWAEPGNIDCSNFTFGGTEPLLASADSDPGFLKSLRKRVAQFFLPDPLVAFPIPGRVPRGIGGLESSFSLHFGAVPEFPVVTVDPTDTGLDPAIVPTAAEAMAFVQPGGTIFMADGSHVVENVIVTKAVTIDEVSGATAVIQNNSGLTSFRVEGVPAGKVTIQNLHFQNNSPGSQPGADPRTSSIDIEGQFDEVVIQDNIFLSDGSVDANSAVRVDTAYTAGSTVLVSNNEITGGLTGVVATGVYHSGNPGEYAASVSVTGNTIYGQERTGVVFQGGAEGEVVDNHVYDSDEKCIQFQNGSNGTISGNQVEDCGSVGGIRIFGGEVDVLNNAISDAEPKPAGWSEDTDPYHNGIRFSSGAIGTIQGNILTGCGWGGCIQVSYGADAIVEGNTVEPQAGQNTEFGILVFGGYDPVDANPPTAIVTNNEITGIGTGTGTRSDNQHYGITEGGILIRNGTVTEFSGNIIDNATWGIDIYENGTISGGTGNRVNYTNGALISTLNGAVSLTGSDFTDYLISIFDVDSSLNGSLTCNWWDDVGGPVNTSISTGSSIIFWPWADGPVVEGPGTCFPPASVSGAVLLDGSPVAAVNVSLVGPQNLNTTTEPDGTYFFPDILPGTSSLSISGYSGDYPYTTMGVEVLPGEAEIVDFNGAHYPSIPSSGIGSAAYWIVSEPSVSTNLCNGDGETPCSYEESLTLTAVAAGQTGIFMPPWMEVHFYFRLASPTGMYRYAGTASGPVLTDSGSGLDGRTYTWSLTFDVDGDHAPTGAVEVIAIGVDGDSNTYHTPVPNPHITVVGGSLGGGGD